MFAHENLKSFQAFGHPGSWVTNENSQGEPIGGRDLTVYGLEMRKNMGQIEKEIKLGSKGCGLTGFG
jgi:hypothetical protein